jgi:hypothetical protein
LGGGVSDSGLDVGAAGIVAARDGAVINRMVPVTTDCTGAGSAATGIAGPQFREETVRLKRGRTAAKKIAEARTKCRNAADCRRSADNAINPTQRITDIRIV